MDELDNMEREASEMYKNSIYKCFKSVIIHMVSICLLTKMILLGLMTVDLDYLLREMVVPLMTSSLLLVMMGCEAHFCSKSKLLYIMSEAVTLGCFLYGQYIIPQQRDIFIIQYVMVTFVLQMNDASKYMTLLIIIKVIFIWYLITILFYGKEIPNTLVPYATIIFVTVVVLRVHTHKKKLLYEFVYANIKVEKMKKQLFEVIQALPESVLILSKSHTIIFQNKASQELFKLCSPSEIEQKIKELKYKQDSKSYQGESEFLIDDIYDYLVSESKTSVTFGITEFENKLLECRGSKCEWDGESLVVLSTRDITAVLEFERAKADANYKTTLLRTVSHEIRNQTNAIISISDEILTKVAELSSDIAENIRIINISSKLLHNLINDLLDFSKMMAECLTINKSEFELKRLLQESFSLFGLQCKTKNLEYVLYIDPLLPQFVNTDPNRLSQIIINLLSNALKFTISGGIYLRATITTTAKLHIEVIDTGSGIPQDKLRDLFSAFNRTHDITLNPEGCGLGLYISNKFSKALGGESIQVTSTFNEGSKFEFDVNIGLHKRLEFYEESEIEEAIISNERSLICIPRSLISRNSFCVSKPSVLVVDDNEFNRKVLSYFLKERNLIHEQASSGLEAVTIIKKLNSSEINIRLVIMDCNMPHMSGIDASLMISKLFENKEIIHLPIIIAHTGDDSEENRKQCYEAGMKDIIIKPISRHAFYNVLRRHIN